MSLVIDPLAVPIDERPKFGLGILPVCQFAQGIHPQFHTLDVRGRHALDLALRNPARADGQALAVFELGLGRNVVANGTLAVVAILEVGDAIVPVFAFQAAEIGPRNVG